MSMKSVVIQEGGRTVPLSFGWGAILNADPSTQITLVAGILTCLYLIAQLWLILRRARIERQKLEMVQREHKATMANLREAAGGDP